MDDDVGRGGELVEVAIRAQRHEDVVPPAFVHELGGRGRRTRDVGIDRQLVVFDLDHLQQVLGFRARGREGQGDRLAHVADLAARQRRLGRLLIGGQRGFRDHVEGVPHLLAQEHELRDLVRNLDGDDARMRERAAQERHVAQARHRHVTDEPPLARKMTRVLLAGHARTDALGLHADRGIAMIHRPTPAVRDPALVINRG